MEKDVVKDSLLVTPIGICLNFYEQSNNFIFVNFNEKRIKLYDNNRLAIVDAAILAEFPNEDLFPKRGESLDFTLNGQAMSLRGKRGESATVWLNGEERLIFMHPYVVMTLSVLFRRLQVKRLPWLCQNCPDIMVIWRLSLKKVR